MMPPTRPFVSLLILASLALPLPKNLRADVVTEWNEAALNAIRRDNVSPPGATRELAIVHAAIFDAVNGIVRRYTPYRAFGHAPRNAQPEVAATAAAHHVLVRLHPTWSSDWDSLHEDILRDLHCERRRERRSIAWGVSVAEAILQWRSADGASAVMTLPLTIPRPGQWRPTLSFGGVVRPALLPHWGSLHTFALEDIAPFRPPPPPALDSPEYADDLATVQAIGRATSDVRTSEETEIARFWGYGPGTATPPGHWNQIAQVVAETEENTLEENARMFALLNFALADAAIVCWECKYNYNFWRPITAVREADLDENPDTTADAEWLPLLATPPFPEYTSGHSTFSGAAAAILARFFGRDDVSFAVGSDDLPDVYRSYARFSEAAYESGLSRVYGGIHFMSGNTQGLICGADIGRNVFENVLQPLRHKLRNRQN